MYTLYSRYTLYLLSVNNSGHKSRLKYKITDPYYGRRGNPREFPPEGVHGDAGKVDRVAGELDNLPRHRVPHLRRLDTH